MLDEQRMDACVCACVCASSVWEAEEEGMQQMPTSNAKRGKGDRGGEGRRDGGARHSLQRRVDVRVCVPSSFLHTSGTYYAYYVCT